MGDKGTADLASMLAELPSLPGYPQLHAWWRKSGAKLLRLLQQGAGQLGLQQLGQLVQVIARPHVLTVFSRSQLYKTSCMAGLSDVLTIVMRELLQRVERMSNTNDLPTAASSCQLSELIQLAELVGAASAACDASGHKECFDDALPALAKFCSLVAAVLHAAATATAPARGAAAAAAAAAAAKKAACPGPAAVKAEAAAWVAAVKIEAAELTADEQAEAAADKVQADAWAAEQSDAAAEATTEQAAEEAEAADAAAAELQQLKAVAAAAAHDLAEVEQRSSVSAAILQVVLPIMLSRSSKLMDALGEVDHLFLAPVVAAAQQQCVPLQCAVGCLKAWSKRFEDLRHPPPVPYFAAAAVANVFNAIEVSLAGPSSWSDVNGSVLADLIRACKQARCTDASLITPSLSMQQWISTRSSSISNRDVCLALAAAGELGLKRTWLAKLLLCLVQQRMQQQSWMDFKPQDHNYLAQVARAVALLQAKDCVGVCTSAVSRCSELWAQLAATGQLPQQQQPAGGSKINAATPGMLLQVRQWLSTLRNAGLPAGGMLQLLCADLQEQVKQLEAKGELHTSGEQRALEQTLRAVSAEPEGPVWAEGPKLEVRLLGSSSHVDLVCKTKDNVWVLWEAEGHQHFNTVTSLGPDGPLTVSLIANGPTSLRNLLRMHRMGPGTRWFAVDVPLFEFSSRDDAHERAAYVRFRFAEGLKQMYARQHVVLNAA